MAGLVRPRDYPIRKISDDKQDLGIVYNPRRMSHHGGLDATSKYPGGDSAFREVSPPTNINPASVSDRSLSE